jgi:hypothetical protein
LWNIQLSGQRVKTRRLVNVTKRTGDWDTCKKVLTCDNKEIRKAKRLSWRRYCPGIADVPGSHRLRKAMAKQTTNRVSNVKHPIYSGWRETLKELFKVHFPDSRLSDDSRDSKGQSNLDVHRCKMNRVD